MNHLPRRYWYDHRGAAVWIICLLVVLWRAYSAAEQPAAPEQLEEGIHEVRRAVDGDTLLLASGAGPPARHQLARNRPARYPHRDLGPRSQPVHQRLPPARNNRVRLTFGLERKDRYDRFLAFVWDGDVMLNEELVRAGLAFARLDYRYSGAMKRRLAAAQDEARQAGRGVWSKSDTQPVNPP